jgi:hypothetical protein
MGPKELGRPATIIAAAAFSAFPTAADYWYFGQTRASAQAMMRQIGALCNAWEKETE